MITLHQFAPALGLPNASPFCMKVETWLRMAGLDYRLDNRGDVLRAPKGKLPWIEDDDGVAVADSGFIVEHLSARHGIALDAPLAPRERAAGLAWRRLFEEHLYWSVVRVRWLTPEGWPLTRGAFFGGLPGPLRAIVPPLARRAMRRELHGHGMGRHAPEEIDALGCADLDAVADWLDDGRVFFLGDAPSSVDATAYAFLANLLWVPLESRLLQRARARPVLEAYCRRMRERYWG